MVHMGWKLGTSGNTEKRVEEQGRIRCVWIEDETLFSVFDIASQRNQYFKGKFEFEVAEMLFS